MKILKCKIRAPSTPDQIKTGAPCRNGFKLNIEIGRKNALNSLTQEQQHHKCQKYTKEGCFSKL